MRNEDTDVMASGGAIPLYVVSVTDGLNKIDFLLKSTLYCNLHKMLTRPY